MKFKGQMLLAVVAALFTVSMAFAFQAEEGKTAESQMKGNGGNGGAGGTGGGTTGTTTGGGTGGGTTGTTTGGGTGGGTTGTTTGGGTGGGTTGTTTGGGTGGGTTGTTTGGGTGGSTDGGTGGGTTGGTDLGCTRTQGYWGNSPAGQRRLIELVGADGMLLGNRVYSAAELDDILDTPVRGNALISLAHQLIASKLNVLNGADDSEIAEDIVAADLLIGDLVVPPVGTDRVSSSSALGQQMLAVKDDLDDYNNGRFNVPHCR